MGEECLLNRSGCILIEESTVASSEKVTLLVLWNYKLSRMLEEICKKTFLQIAAHTNIYTTHPLIKKPNTAFPYKYFVCAQQWGAAKPCTKEQSMHFHWGTYFSILIYLFIWGANERPVPSIVSTMCFVFAHNTHLLFSFYETSSVSQKLHGVFFSVITPFKCYLLRRDSIIMRSHFRGLGFGVVT